MLREAAHFVLQAPKTLALKARSSRQTDLYETVMTAADGAGLGAQRAALVDGLHGNVLEIGSGTGRMFEHYAKDVDLTAVEPDADFAARAVAAASDRAQCKVTLAEGRGESLSFAGGTFDAAVVALVLCSVEDPGAVLREIARVLRPGAEVRLLEHVVSERRVPAALMHALDPVWLKLNGQGCHMDRDPVPAIEAAGFVIERCEAFQIFGPYLPAFPMKRFTLRRP